MELKNLLTVKKIIETGNYKNAARALNYAQSTITFQMKQLESELGIQIFEKNGNRMELTQAGLSILPIIDRILASTKELICYKDSIGEIRGTLKVALPETLITYQIQPILRAFKEKAPNVKLSLQVMNCYAIQENLINGNIDIAIHYEISKYPRSITTNAIKTYPLVLVASPALDENQRDFISSGQKKSICHIQNDPNALYLKIFNQYLKEKDIVLDTELELWSIETIKQSVMSNLGIAYLPRFTVETELKQGKMIGIETEINNGEITAVFAYNKIKWMSPALRLFLQLLETSKLVEISE
ncbi:LysR family transcriptional regulator [Acetobacterium wieringae]|uniref:LysR family transcriptional regulator n=1 Tax=Acetobacterium wieringae TaxID=52694 RepID=A0ABY6HFT4_9FIRM|nr:LysR family transcriptional regulator [Acetobacterium wieringae]UYO62754.1 LysR family transcriptional regulator [Acetobacterium wieringae]VUZ26453.1 HTH-type transcriptional activator CmpR [Acetobacterium wieringae]